MFKVKNENTRTMFHSFVQCFYCLFEQVNVSWADSVDTSITGTDNKISF